MLAAFILAGCSLGLTLGAVLTWRSRRRFLAAALSAEGRVVGNDERRVRRQGRWRRELHPVVEFNADAGTTLRLTGQVGARVARYPVGTTLRVRFLPGHAADAVIERWEELWFLPLLLGSFALVGWLSSGLVFALDPH